MSRYRRPFDRLQKKYRAQVALWAYAYEVENDNLVPDNIFDYVCRLIDVTVPTDRSDLDIWFRENFDPSTGMWIRKHPEINRLKEIYRGIKTVQFAS